MKRGANYDFSDDSLLDDNPSAGPSSINHNDRHFESVDVALNEVEECYDLPTIHANIVSFIAKLLP